MATMNRITADGPLPENRLTTADPLGVNSRLYSQISKLLDDMESADRDNTMSFPQRLNAIIAVGRVLIMQAALRKAEAKDGTTAGSAVRRYSAAFKSSHANRRRTNDAGSDDDDTVVQLASTGGDSGDDAA